VKEMMIQFVKNEALVMEINQFRTVRPPAATILVVILSNSEGSLTRKLDVSKNNSNNRGDDQSKSRTSLIIDMCKTCRNKTLMGHSSQDS
jgi:hypothetical protein